MVETYIQELLELFFLRRQWKVGYTFFGTWSKEMRMGRDEVLGPKEKRSIDLKWNIVCTLMDKLFWNSRF
jgi:hypothetical protein